ncbi:MAG: hypothetical protein AB1558_05810, partial [Thermodesulfobacteriota bacterium]
MKRLRKFVMVLCVVVAAGVMPAAVWGEEYRIAFLQTNGDDVQTYQHLAEHMTRTGVSVKLVEVSTYGELKRKL